MLDNVNETVTLVSVTRTESFGLTKSSVAPVLAARKRAFRIALALRGWTASQFAARHGVSKQALSAVLNGRDASAKIDRAIARFIAQYNQEAA